MSEKSKSVRLPKTIRPTVYDLTLVPNLEKFTFSGKVTICVNVLKETSEIVLHAQELTIQNVIFKKDMKNVAPVSISMDEENERATFIFSKPIPTGDARLDIVFDGVLNDQMAGFYRSMYEVEGEKKIMATTQFEDTDARRAFPCWDEPSIKAKFKVSFEVPQNLNVLSNMSVEKEVLLGNGKKTVCFETTPIMSTYLLAFVVGELEHIEGTTKNGTLVRVFTTPGKKEQGQFALDTGIKTLEFYNEYFDIPYPLPKLDMIAIPDFSAGAMENWGLITYRETAILYDPQNSSSARKQRVAIVVAHEIAHQWFGNLVTMEWWTQLWLNEGFATWMEYLAVDHIFPEWKIWEQFISHDYCSALSDDGLRTTHSIEIEINHPSEIGQNFDAISYQKGAAIIRMIHAHLGADTFREGMRSYLKKYAYSNATTEDLWQSLEDVSGKPVREIMNTWTKQPGYPLVTVDQVDETTLTLTQARFLSSGRDLSDYEKKQKWGVSLVHQHTNDSNESGTVLLSTVSKFDTLHFDKNALPILNIGQVAFARLNYSSELWESIRNEMAVGNLSSIDKVGTMDDLYALIEAGVLPATKIFPFFTASSNESEYIIWTEIVGSLGGISSLVPEKGVSREQFNAFARSVLKNIVQKMGWEKRKGESHSDTLLRPMVLGSYGGYKDKDTIREAKECFQSFLKNPGTLDVNLRAVVYRLVARTGGVQEYDTLIDCFHKAESQEDKVYFLLALGGFKNKKALERFLAFSMSDAVRPQDMMYCLRGAGKMASELKWKFLQENWSELRRRYEGSIMTFSSIIESVLNSFDTEERAKEIELFFEKHPVPKVSQAISQSLERIRSKDLWIKRDQTVIKKWLSNWATN